jgi:hypothetical protein
MCFESTVMRIVMEGKEACRDYISLKWKLDIEKGMR